MIIMWTVWELLSEMIELENKDVVIMLSFVLVVYFIFTLISWLKSNSFKIAHTKLTNVIKRK